MSSAAILFRSDAQCVRVNKFVRLSHFICLPSDLPLPIPYFKNTQQFLPSSLLGGPSPSPSPTPSLSLSSPISILTVPLHPSSSILSSPNPFQLSRHSN